MLKSFRVILFFPTVSLVLCACGVKGPPLPPVSDTPQASENQSFLPTPVPSPSPSPRPRTIPEE